MNMKVHDIFIDGITLPAGSHIDQKLERQSQVRIWFQLFKYIFMRSLQLELQMVYIIDVNYPFSVTTASGIITITPYWG